MQGSNPLADALSRAMTDAGEQAAFWRALARSDLHVLGRVAGAAPGTVTRAEKGDQLELGRVHFEGKDWIPVFSSAERLAAFARGPAPSLIMNALDLFQGIASADFWLDPGSRPSKPITAPEVEAVISGAAWGMVNRAVTQPTKMLLGTPARMPDEVIVKLKAAFARDPGVAAAWLAWMVGPDAPDGIYLLAVDHDGDLARIRALVAEVLTREVTDRWGPFDLMRVDRALAVDRDDPLGAGILPFHRRGAFLAS